MKPRHPADPHARRAIRRDAALARLSRLTTATAIAGTVATVGFGGLAAVTYSGVSPADAAQDPTQPEYQAVPQYQGQSGVGSGSSNQQNLPSVPSATLPPTTNRTYTYVQPPVRTSRRGRVSSGGSG